ncbi:MAG: hypothetical protein JOY99_08045 [Sphingomonadaceae bacterium]|nr:hypothetical protein [Sphingomonadaceae bacterium]
MRWIGCLRQLWDDRRAAVTLLTAGSLTALLGFLALAVDMGSVYLDSRRLQGIADAAALAAAGTSGDPRAAAVAAISASGWAHPYTLALTTGSYAPNPAVAPAARYTAGSGSGAARVTLTSGVPLFFATALVGRHQAMVARTATAARLDEAAFSIGSRLAALNGGIANALLSGLTGSTVNLSVSDYDALLSANVDAFSYVSALRTELHLTGASYDQTLDTTVTMPQALSALASALTGAGNSAAARAVTQIAAQAGSVANVQLSNMIDLGPAGVQDAVSGGTTAAVNAFDLTRTALALANGGHQIQLTSAPTSPACCRRRSASRSENRTSIRPG